MRKFFRWLALPLTWLVQACSPLGEPVDEEISDNFYYDKDRTDIIYSSMGNWFELGETALNAHSESFEVLNAHLGKDKHQAYYKWYTIPSSEIDLRSFDASYADWMWHIGMDKDQVYAFGDDVIDGEWQLLMSVIEGADPDSFEKIDYQWAKDKNHYFYDHQIIAVIYDSFEVINETFARDSDSVYLYYQGRLASIDANTDEFKQIDQYYARDATSIYFFLDYAKGEQIEKLQTIPYQDLKTIKVLEENYLLVDQSVFYRGILLEEANPTRLKALSSEFAKDDTYVYYQDVIIDGADAATFSWDDETFSYQDKHRSYTHDEITQRTTEK